MTYSKTTFCVVISLTFVQSFALADEGRDVPVYVRNTTGGPIRLELTITKSSACREGSGTWDIPVGGPTRLLMNGRPLLASSVTYSLEKKNGMRSPGDPFKVYVMKENGGSRMTIGTNSRDVYRHPTPTESRQYREYLRMQADFEIDLMRMVNDAWDF